uniref:Uncharacterized protein n=1 Tax=Tanacetum cinerariifolium TaxID=118510 RepID=A0A6L2N4F4_TANCI|nr:hypothetical protein [Tanacetum cinerariifolium]
MNEFFETYLKLLMRYKTAKMKATELPKLWALCLQMKGSVTVQVAAKLPRMMLTAVNAHFHKLYQLSGHFPYARFCSNIIQLMHWSTF